MEKTELAEHRWSGVRWEDNQGTSATIAKKLGFGRRQSIADPSDLRSATRAA